MRAPAYNVALARLEQGPNIRFLFLAMNFTICSFELTEYDSRFDGKGPQHQRTWHQSMCVCVDKNFALIVDSEVKEKQLIFSDNIE